MSSQLGFALRRAGVASTTATGGRPISIVYYYRDGQAPHFTGALRQDYTAVRTPAGWRIREVRIMPAWTRD
ncbi:hypothetical protein [Actinoallomurus iriomotensis]|uniref:Uncharacterized protein n=1 Tax=Actinoallomurus iriomotensis TaxID=478107 RepID=A0A9W6SGV9_9ACTN|nr:hypothetical protein [Actinoallomurus iriomotensis]GLY92710.1 hypothetical protein Airi02_106380 [Actinoallomurus iriomotensis]